MRVSPVNYSLLTGSESVQAASQRGESSKFSDLLASLKAGKAEPKSESFAEATRQNAEKSASAQERKTSAIAAANGAVASDQVNNGNVNGDFLSSNTKRVNIAEKTARAQGMGASIANGRTIDKTSELYTKAQELETFMVKQMLSSMRKTINKGGLIGGDDFAGKMYEDMMFDEYAERMTRSAGFGLADAVYLQLSQASNS